MNLQAYIIIYKGGVNNIPENGDGIISILRQGNVAWKISGSMGHDHIPQSSIKFQQSLHKQGDNGVQNTSAFIVDADGSGLGV